MGGETTETGHQTLGSSFRSSPGANVNLRSVIFMILALNVGVWMGMWVQRHVLTQEFSSVSAEISSSAERSDVADQPVSVAGVHDDADHVVAHTRAEVDGAREDPAPSFVDGFDRDANGIRDRPAPVSIDSEFIESQVARAEARADFEKFGDGPVARTPSEVERLDDSNERSHKKAAEDEQVEQDGKSCLGPGMACRRDTDCCGASVCRSRPGTISGHFECTAM